MYTLVKQILGYNQDTEHFHTPPEGVLVPHRNQPHCSQHQATTALLLSL